MIVQVDIFKEMAEVEFSDIVVDVLTDLNTLRVIFTDDNVDSRASGVSRSHRRKESFL